MNIFMPVSEKETILNSKVAKLGYDIDNFFPLSKKEEDLIFLNFEKALLLKYTTNIQKNNFGRKWKKVIKKLIAKQKAQI